MVDSSLLEKSVLNEKNIFNGFYKNKKILLTGHTGFKGAWLTYWLTLMGAEVIGYSREIFSGPSLFTVLALEENITHIEGNVRNYNHLKDVFKKHKPDLVFHLAAQAIVRYSYTEPLETFSTNIMGTANLLEAVKNSSVQAVVNVTTDKCYENMEWHWPYRETDRLGGFDPYSSSKACSEIVTSSMRRSFYNLENPIGLASARAGNVIGGGDWAEDRIIPDCIRAIVKDEPIILRNPNAVRPWQHVLEPLSGYLLLGQLLYSEPEKYGSAWNFGPAASNVLTVEKLAQVMTETWGSGEYRVEGDAGLHEATLLTLDISKARNILKWSPVMDAEETMKMTVNWYKEYYHHEDNRLNIELDNPKKEPPKKETQENDNQKSDHMRKVTLNQINQFIEKANNLGINWSQK